MPSTPANKRTNRSPEGFTLVEILVVVPVVILVIAVLVGFLVTLTGDAMMARERGSMVYTAQDALNQIEQDIRLSTSFMNTTGSLTSPQGSDNGTAAFSTPSEQLILSQYATVGSPYDGTRSLAYYSNRPNACNDFHEYNEAAQSTVVYFVKNGDLHKRTIVDLTGLICNAGISGVWQVNSCDSDLDKVRCIARDAILASNVSSFSISYYVQPDSTLPTVLGTSPRGVTTASVSITLSKQVAGETIEHTNIMRASRINSGQAWNSGT